MVGLAIFLVGVGILVGVERKYQTHLPLVVFLAIGFLVGTIWHGLVLTLLDLLKIPWVQGWMWVFDLPWIFIALSQWRRWKRVHLAKHDRPFVVFLGLVVAGLLVSQLSTAYLHSDGLTLWFMKGKLLALDKGITTATITHPVFSYVTEGEAVSMAKYPILVPLQIAWVYRALNTEAVVQAKWLWVWVHLSILLMLYSVRRSLVDVLIYLVIPVTFRHFSPHWFGNADIWLAAWYLSGTWLLYLWYYTYKRLYLLLAMLFFGAATVTKVEGLVAVGVILIYFLMAKKIKRFETALLGLVLVPGLLWYGYTATLPLENDYLSQIVARFSELPSLFSRTGLAVLLIAKEFFAIQHYLLFWPIVLGLLSWKLYRGKREKWMWLYLLPLLGLVFMVVSYTFNPLPLEELVQSTIQRLFAQWIPTVYLLSLIAITQPHEVE